MNATLPVSTFAELGLRSELQAALYDLGYEEPTPVQAAAIPVALGGRDLVGSAATGTGKTAAFALPILEALEVDAGRARLQALVLVPTRELAMQVSEAMFKYGRSLGARVVPIYGGQSIGRQLGALERGVHVVVGTPGRVLDHLTRGSLDLSTIRTVVLDEADEMLDMGFADELDAIVDALPAERQTLLFSATMPPRIDRIVRTALRDPERVAVGSSEQTAVPALVSQRAYIVPRQHKATALGRLLDIESPEATLVFCRTRNEVDELTTTMTGRGYRAEPLHGGMDQSQRTRVMARLRDGTAELLVATDVAARGLDVDTLTHVVNYDVPSAPASYVHRIGRVGRAGRRGAAITLAEPRERRLLKNIERQTGQPVEIGPVPSVADLRASQVAQTRQAVRESLDADDIAEYTALVTDLVTDGADASAVAAAAVRLVHLDRAAVGDDIEIPTVPERPDRRDGSGRGDRRDRRDGGGRGDRGDRGDRGGGGRRDGDDTALIYLNAGRKSGVRPADLVGAVANEAGLPGRDIGPIRIGDYSSTVGVPRQQLGNVVEALSGALIRGRPVAARPWTERPARGRTTVQRGQRAH